MADSIFTKIYKDEVPGYKIYESENFFVILDIFPASTGHMLVISKSEYENVLELPEEITGEAMEVGQKMAKLLKKTFSPEGIKFIQNNGAEADQAVMHYHLHIIGYYKDSTKNEIKKDFETVQKGLLKNLN